jgi:hypothetical protein
VHTGVSSDKQMSCAVNASSRQVIMATRHLYASFLQYLFRQIYGRFDYGEHVMCYRHSLALKLVCNF